jgi:hypothetical protein
MTAGVRPPRVGRNRFFAPLTVTAQHLTVGRVKIRLNINSSHVSRSESAHNPQTVVDVVPFGSLLADHRNMKKISTSTYTVSEAKKISPAGQDVNSDEIVIRNAARYTSPGGQKLPNKRAYKNNEF